MTAAAITASLCDWKNVKTRSVVQLILEVPVEQALLAFQTLGMPQPGSEIPVAVALLRSAGKVSPDPAADAGTGNALPGQTDLVASSALTEAVAVSAPKQRRHFSELPRSQQAGMLCNDPRFQKWMGVSTSEEAALRVRIHCQVNSRSWLDDYLHYPEAAGKWDGLAIVFHAENSLMAEMR